MFEISGCTFMYLTHFKLTWSEIWTKVHRFTGGHPAVRLIFSTNLLLHLCWKISWPTCVGLFLGCFLDLFLCFDVGSTFAMDELYHPPKCPNPRVTLLEMGSLGGKAKWAHQGGALIQQDCGFTGRAWPLSLPALGWHSQTATLCKPGRKLPGEWIAQHLGLACSSLQSREKINCFVLTHAVYGVFVTAAEPTGTHYLHHYGFVMQVT